MLKLYKSINHKMHYWETWDSDQMTGVVHFGLVGDRGESNDFQSTPGQDFHEVIQGLINEKVAVGYRPFDDHYTLLIEYDIEGMGAAEDLDKRHALEERMNETLGWTGLGHCDGGSIGSGTMEVCCFVVDFEVAKMVIQKDLIDSVFADYSRIYDENAS